MREEGRGRRRAGRKREEEDREGEEGRKSAITAIDSSLRGSRGQGLDQARRACLPSQRPVQRWHETRAPGLVPGNPLT